MKEQRAIRILQALVAGTDPFTDEELPLEPCSSTPMSCEQCLQGSAHFRTQ